MARMSRFLICFVTLVTVSLVTGCTSDPMGLRSTYRDRVVPPSSNHRPISNSPIALQSGLAPGTPVATGPALMLPQSGISNQVLASGSTPGLSGPYPMLASASRQADGRAFPLLTKEVRKPRFGGAVHRNQAVQNTAITGGFATSPAEDLKYRGGRTIRDLKYLNIYVGGSEVWDANDWKNIDKKLAAAMSDRKLNNVLLQYFDQQRVTSQFLGSFFMSGWKPRLVKKNDLETQIQLLYRQRAFGLNKAIPLAEAEDSTGGLGGYHGSAHIDGKTIYYSVGVFSERLPNGGANGIPVFDQNWKNVVATFYHELQEARTDPDVDDAATDPRGLSLIGWTSDSGQEIGDYPIAEAKDLLQVFKEVLLADGSGTVPIQLCYSNAVHGPEGPIDYPHGMEPRPGTVPPREDPVPVKPDPNPTAPKGPTIPENLPPKVQKMITDWNHLEDYVKLAILKLLS